MSNPIPCVNRILNYVFKNEIIFLKCYFIKLVFCLKSQYKLRSEFYVEMVLLFPVSEILDPPLLLIVFDYVFNGVVDRR